MADSVLMPFSYRGLDDSDWYVYLIKNIQNGKNYIGITSKGISKRWRQHCADAKRGSGTALHKAIRKYGENGFSVSELMFFRNQIMAVNAEKSLIAEYGSMIPNGYNMTFGGEISPMHTPEIRAKVSGENNPNFGKRYKLSEETKSRMSAARMGHKTSEETRLKIGKKNAEKPSKSMQGKTHSEHTKEKMRLARVGIVFSDDHKRNLSDAHKGYMPTSEQKQKLSDAMKEVWRLRKLEKMTG